MNAPFFESFDLRGATPKPGLAGLTPRTIDGIS